MKFDNVLAAIGQEPEISEKLGLPVGSGNTIKINPETLAISRKGVFAGGDVATGLVSVVEAMAAGRKVAASIDKYLGGSGNIEGKLVYVEEPSLCLGPGDGFADQERVSIPCLSLEQRRGNFAEVELGFDK